jgi:UDP-GlcNAc:undecaprenyl-phosphate GlcNAc-1-phosphate transferase
MYLDKIITLSILLIFINSFCIIFFDKISKFFNIYDIPDYKRKLHKAPVSLLGGVIIFINILTSILFIFIDLEFKSFGKFFYIYSYKSFIVFLFILSSIFILGYLDDRKNLSPLKRLVILTILIYFICVNDKVAIIDTFKFSFLENSINFNQLSIPFSIACYIFLIVALNMFDGINLQSSTFYIINFLIIFFHLQFYNLIIFSIVVGLIFFSFLNFKNKCFLGDSGSYLLSFIFGYYIIRVHNNTDIYFSDQIVLILFFPVLDTLRVILLRQFNGKQIFLPDNNHLHHMMIKKYGYNKTIIYLIFAIIMPHILIYIGLKSFISLLILLFVYFFTIKILKKN